MRIFRSIDIEEKFSNPILTIGNYDGIHLGHRRIIERVKEMTRAVSGTSVLMTFDPHPLHLLKPDKELAAITPPEEKERVIAETGIDLLFIVPFTSEFSQISPETFVSYILVERLGVKGVVIGYDFKFGREGIGDTSFLMGMGKRHGFSVEVVDAVIMDGDKVGSNRIRKLVAEGEVARAARLLGRPYSMSGIVVRARGRGRSIGFPTVNLHTHYPLVPKRGVYVSEVEFDGVRHPGVTNVGYNPTFGDQERSIETFIIDFKDDLYDKELKLYFLERIRDEVKFSDADELKARIAGDVEAAKEYFRGGSEKGRP